MEWNVEWLFLNSTTKTIKCPGDCPWKHEADAVMHLKSIASYIRAANADMIVLAEVQDCDVGNMLLQEIGDPALRFYLVPGTDTATGQNVALLTRIDPSNSLSRSEERVQYPVRASACGYTGGTGEKRRSKLDSSGVSKHFIARFNFANPLCNQLSSSCSAPALDVSLIAAHLVAKPVDPRACAQREAQATVIRRIILSELEEGRHVIVAGDMNDYDGRVKDSFGHVPNSMALEIMTAPGSGNARRLVSAGERVKQSDRFTDWYDIDNDCVDDGGREHSAIDHVLLSEELNRAVSRVSYGHDFKPAEFCDRTQKVTSNYSDHWPIHVEFDLSILF